MSDDARYKLTVFRAHTWGVLIAALFVVAVFVFALHMQGERGQPSARQPAQSASDKDTETEMPAAVLVALALPVSLIILSYGWLGGVTASGGRVFGFPRPQAAWWTHLDVFAVFLFYLVLTGLCGLTIGMGSVDLLLAADSVIKLAMAGLMLRVIRARGQDASAALGLQLRGLARPLISGLAVFCAFLPVLVAVRYGWQWVLEWCNDGALDHVQQSVRLLGKSQSVPVVAQLAVAAVLVAPVVEEMFFRGLLYGTLKRHVRPAFAMAAVGVLFGLVHPPVAAQIPMCLFGALLCYIYEKTGRLMVPVAIHLLFNLYSIGLIISMRLFPGGGP
ncbi:MAG: CPBP family intramembrane glutamic endopeptidase [Planctomycetota bacterium]